MQFTTFALSALSAAGALGKSECPRREEPCPDSVIAQSNTTPSGAMTTVHVVRVGGLDGSLTFSPDNVKANIGDMVQFQFAPKNHSVVTSTFDAPCAPAGSIFSGYMPVSPNASTTATYTIPVKDTKPMWIYCSQGKHCQSGMAMVINQAASGNKTLAAYKELAGKATSNTAPSSPSGGSAGTNSTSGGSSGGSSSGSGTSEGSASPTEGSSGAGSSGAATSSGAGAGASQTTTASAATLSTSASLGLLLVVAAFFL
ncbi:Cupredoxin [Amylocarpus encephaloides]|uniref:Cupredoxin n=1 Tax=Amylocarpus encephaloides TaxID=45428 RepID=A0A9P7YMM2_9HELO|nr:Cupredoxin [Amylocarpus encephaloides]